MTPLLTVVWQRRVRFVPAAVLLLFAAVSLPSQRLQAQDGPSLVILVRHAEKAAVAGNDPPLSELGRARAAALAAALKLSPPSAVVTTPLQRTFETAAGVLKDTGLQPEKIALNGGTAKHVEAVAAAVMKHHGVVLVVGHSNTIPAIVTALGGPVLPEICDATYSYFFTVVPAKGTQPAAVTISRFGANEDAPPASCQGMVAK